MRAPWIFTYRKNCKRAGLRFSTRRNGWGAWLTVCNFFSNLGYTKRSAAMFGPDSSTWLKSTLDTLMAIEITVEGAVAQIIRKQKKAVNSALKSPPLFHGDKPPPSYSEIIATCKSAPVQVRKSPSTPPYLHISGETCDCSCYFHIPKTNRVITQQYPLTAI